MRRAWEASAGLGRHCSRGSSSFTCSCLSRGSTLGLYADAVAALPVPGCVTCWSGLWPWLAGLFAYDRTKAFSWRGDGFCLPCCDLGFQIPLPQLSSNCSYCSLTEMWDPQEDPQVLQKDQGRKEEASLRTLPLASFSQDSWAEESDIIFLDKGFKGWLHS